MSRYEESLQEPEECAPPIRFDKQSSVLPVDGDVLGSCELQHAVVPAFTTQTGLIDTTERRRGI